MTNETINQFFLNFLSSFSNLMLDFHKEMPIGFYFMVFLIGISISSFINVYVLRYKKIEEFQVSNGIKDWLTEKGFPQSWPNELDPLLSPISYSHPRSHCYHCNNVLKWWHNLPIIGYLILRGKCGWCSKPFSSKYALTEFFGGVLSIFVVASFINFNFWLALLMFVLSLFYYAAIIVDFKYKELPDEITFSTSILILFASSIGLLSFNPYIPLSFTDSIISGFIAFSFFWIVGFIGEKLLGTTVLGFGDYKLILSLAMLVGTLNLPLLVFFASFSGLIHSIIIKMKTRFDYSNSIDYNDKQIPFGPHLILALVLVFIFHIF